MPRRHTLGEDEVRYNPQEGQRKYNYFKQVGNWTKCPNCKGTGKTRDWDPKTGREISVDTCVTCGGLGGWPTVTHNSIDARMRRARVEPLMI